VFVGENLEPWEANKKSDESMSSAVS